MHPVNLVVLLITFAALLHASGVIVSNSCPFPGFGKGPQDPPHAPFFVEYDPKGVALSDVDLSAGQPSNVSNTDNDFKTQERDTRYNTINCPISLYQGHNLGLYVHQC